MTPKERAAMQQALDALEVHQPDPEQQMVTEAIIALREALAGDNMSPTEQAQQESAAERKAQVNELIKESARLIASISDEGDRYLTAIDTLRNAYRLGLKDAAPVKNVYYQEAYDALEAQLIKEPTGNGLDQVAQNNGLVMAMNTIQHILKKEKSRG